MKFEQSELLNNLPTQFFSSLVAKVNKKIATGEDVINLGQGNPDQPAYPFIVESLIEASQNPTNHKSVSYTHLTLPTIA